MEFSSVIGYRPRFILIVFILGLFSIQSWAQGDYAPFEQKEKLKKELNKNLSPADQKKIKAGKKIKPKNKDTGQDATVEVDGSAVYEVPNFDSPVIEYMDQGKKIKISKKIYPGIGGLGAFYKVRIKKAVYGYITDTDVSLGDKKSGKKSTAEDNKEQEYDDSDDPTKIQDEMYSNQEEPDVDNSFYLTKYIGLSYASFNYAETIKNRTETENVTLFGVRRSGPTSMMGGMPLDLNLVYTSTAPGFYDDIASSASGFMIIADAIALMPMYESKRILVYYGFGLVTRYSKWSVKLKSQPGSPALDSQEAALGAAVAGGLGLLITPTIALKADVKYYYESEKYFGYGAALQFKY